MLGTFADMRNSKKKYNLKENVNLKYGINKFIDWYIKYYKVKKQN